MVRFHQALSESSVYFRFFGTLKLETRTAHERLARICLLDCDRQMALVAEATPLRTGSSRSSPVARPMRLPRTREAEFAWHFLAGRGQGLGPEAGMCAAGWRSPRSRSPAAS